MSSILLTKSSFIHIPKCAGTLVQAFLNVSGLRKHRYASPQDGHLFLHQMPDSKDKYNFTFVRNPYTWWPSFWQWSKSGAADRFSKSERECPDFDTWIQDYGPFWLGFYTQLVKRYIGEDPLYQSENKMHFIGKSENLYPDLYTALSNAGEDITKQRFDQLVSQAPEKLEKWSNKQEYNRIISDASKEMIYKTERWVFNRFGYTQEIILPSC